MSTRLERPSAWGQQARVALFYWGAAVFNIVANYLVYTRLQGSTRAGKQYARMVGEYLVPISALVTLVVATDRLLSRGHGEAAPGTALTALEGLRLRNGLRLAVFTVSTLLSLPWILAVVGIYISDVPVLSAIFLGRQPYQGQPAVHLGNHHGWDGYLFIVLALAGSFMLEPRTGLRTRSFRALIAGGCTWLAGYGVVALGEDFMNEQLLKRGIYSPLYPWFNRALSHPHLYEIVGGVALAVAVGWYLLGRLRRT